MPTVCRSCCSSPVSGTIKGCDSLVLPSATLTVEDHTTHAVLGTITTNGSGVVSGSPSVTVGQSIDLIESSGRFATKNVTVGAGLSLGTVTLSAGSSYVCACSCVYPIAKTLVLTDSLYGTQSLVWNAGSSEWIASTTTATDTNAANVNCVPFFGGDGNCPSVTNAAINWFLSTTCGLTINYLGYQASGVQGCPYEVTGLPNPPNATQLWSVGPTSGTFTCPPSFSASFTVGVDYLYQAATSCQGTITITE